MHPFCCVAAGTLLVLRHSSKQRPDLCLCTVQVLSRQLNAFAMRVGVRNMCQASKRWQLLLPGMTQCCYMRQVSQQNQTSCSARLTVSSFCLWGTCCSCPFVAIASVYACLADVSLLLACCCTFSCKLLLLQAAFPAFIIHLLGIKTDLQDLEAWK
jgi:hypothetical protein